MLPKYMRITFQFIMSSNAWVRAKVCMDIVLSRAITSSGRGKILPGASIPKISIKRAAALVKYNFLFLKEITRAYITIARAKTNHFIVF